MPRRLGLMLGLGAIFLLSLTGCGGSAPPTSFLLDQEPEQGPQVPEEYSGFHNQFIDDPDAMAAGEELYEANCSACHGLTGEGDGPAAGNLNPPPANLAERQANLSDAYLYWRISEGGLMEPFDSIMPGWKGLLDEEQIWQIIAYIRTMIVL
jgi:mono/diheme cytochrome c family protein